MEPENTYQPPRTDIGGDRQPPPGRRASVRGDVIAQLSKTRPWVLFLAIVAFLFAGLMGVALLGIAMVGVVGGLGSLGSGEFGSQGSIMLMEIFIYGVLFLVMTAAYCFIGLHLFRYARSISTLKDDASEDSLLAAITHQRKFWRLMGIVTLVGVAMYCLILLLAMVGGVLGSMA